MLIKIPLAAQLTYGISARYLSKTFHNAFRQKVNFRQTRNFRLTFKLTFLLDSDEPLSSFRVRSRPAQPLPASITSIISNLNLPVSDANIPTTSSVSSVNPHTLPQNLIASGKKSFLL